MNCCWQSIMYIALHEETDRAECGSNLVKTSNESSQVWSALSLSFSFDRCQLWTTPRSKECNFPKKSLFVSMLNNKLLYKLGAGILYGTSIMRHVRLVGQIFGSWTANYLEKQLVEMGLAGMETTTDMPLGACFSVITPSLILLRWRCVVPGTSSICWTRSSDADQSRLI